MSAIEQLFDTNIHHFSFRYRANPSFESDVERRQPAINGHLREHAQAHG